MNKKTKAQKTRELRNFPLEVVKLKSKAGKLGLYKTMHSLEAATQEVGYEIAEKIEKGEIW